MRSDCSLEIRLLELNMYYRSPLRDGPTKEREEEDDEKERAKEKEGERKGKKLARKRRKAHRGRKQR